MLDKGMVHAYYGNGKGKTTSAIGLGIRAVGGGLKVCMIQFLKTWETGELKAIEKLEPEFIILRKETPKGFFNELSPQEKTLLAQEIGEEFDLAYKYREICDILILDEILGVIENQLIPLERLVDFITSKPRNLELVITGRKLPETVKALSDYVSEIKSIKHPNDTGKKSRKGIEY